MFETRPLIWPSHRTIKSSCTSRHQHYFIDYQGEYMGYWLSVRSRWLDIGQVLCLRVYGSRRRSINDLLYGKRINFDSHSFTDTLEISSSTSICNCSCSTRFPWFVKPSSWNDSKIKSSSMTSHTHTHTQSKITFNNARKWLHY